MESESGLPLFEILSILGALAWLPSIIALVKKQLSNPKLTILTDKDVEIGYTASGPIFNIQLAFLAENKKALIQSVIVELTHNENETQKFTWDWFEETLYSVSTPESGRIPTKKNQKAIAINIEPNSLVEKKIGFQQNSFKAEKRLLIEETTEEYLNIYNAKGNLNDIRSRTSFNNLRDHFKNGFTWKIGDYNVKIIAYLTTGQTFEEQVAFRLTSLDIETLEANIGLAQKLVDKEYGKDVEIENDWLWVNKKTLSED